jgi:urease accessory protein
MRDDASDTRWSAHLRLRFAREGARTLARERAHTGPLRVLKTLYPEGEGIAHTVVVHPPAGIAARDTLAIDCEVESGAHAVIATPSAQKWYRQGIEARGEAGRSDTVLRVADAGVLEWVPQEAIVFDGCIGEQTIALDVATGGKALAWEMVQLGRTDAGERFAHGRFAQTLRISLAGTLVLTERMVLVGDDRSLRDPNGNAPFSVVGNFFLAGCADDQAALAMLRAQCAGVAFPCGATRIAAGCIFVKALAHRAEDLRSFFVQCRRVVRASWCGVRGDALRIWST